MIWLKKQLSRLLFSDDFYQYVFKLYYCPLFKPLALRGVFADVVGVDKSQVDAYLASFYTRDEVGAVQAMKNTAPSKDSTDNIDYADLATAKSILQELKTDDNPNNHFAKELLALPMSEITIPDEPDSSEGKYSMIAFRFPNKKTKQLAKNEAHWKALWQFAHELMVKTNRYPVLVMEWGLIHDDDWENFVERGVYEGEDFDGDRVGLSARDIAKGAENVDLPAILRAIAIEYGANVEEFLEYECGIEDKGLIAELVASFEESANDDNGDGDDEDNIDFIALAKRAFAHEVATHGKPDASPEYLTWHLPSSNPNSYDEAYLLLLPTQNAWEVPAYVNFYGAGSYGTEVLIAQLKQWHEQYGMQVHWALGTMMNITVEKRPSTEEEAVELAYIQHLLAPSTYAPSGFSMSEYAMTLMQSDKWFLHERP